MTMVSMALLIGDLPIDEIDAHHVVDAIPGSAAPGSIPPLPALHCPSSVAILVTVEPVISVTCRLRAGHHAAEVASSPRRSLDQRPRRSAASAVRVTEGLCAPRRAGPSVVPIGVGCS